MSQHLIDYHCHLDLYPNFETLVAECEKAQIHTLAVTTTPKAWPRNYALTKNLKFVRAALGLHPQLVGQRSDELSLWMEYLQQAKFVGEIGLDAGLKFFNSLDKQIVVFDNIIHQCSRAGGKILSVHSVRSASQVLSIFKKHDLLMHNKAVLHWFTGSQADARRAVEMGCYFSVNLQMLSNMRSLETLKLVPNRLILTETDGPFTTLHGKNQRPVDVFHCVEKLASIWNQSTEETQEILLGNLKELEQF